MFTGIFHVFSHFLLNKSSKVQAIVFFLLLMCAGNVVAQDRAFVGITTEAKSDNTTPIEVILFDSPRNFSFGLINYPNEGCSTSIRTSDDNSLAYREILNHGRCRLGLVKLEVKDNELHYKLFHRNDRDLELPRVTAVLKEDNISLAFQEIANEFKESYPKALPVSASKLDLESFPRLYGDNGITKKKAILPFLDLLDHNCAVVNEPNNYDYKLMTLENLSNCPMNIGAFKLRVKEYLQEPLQINYAHVENFEFVKKCAEYEYVAKFAFSMTHSLLKNVEFSERIMRNFADRSSRGYEQGAIPKCLREAMSRAYDPAKKFADPYQEFATLFTAWEANPNIDKSLTPALERQFLLTKKAIDNAYANFKPYDVSGMYLGQSIEDVAKLFPELKSQIKPDYHYLTYIVSGSIQDVSPDRFLNDFYSRAGSGKFNPNDAAAKIASSLSIEKEEAELIKSFLATYKTLSNEEKISLHSVLDAIEGIFSRQNKRAVRYRENTAETESEVSNLAAQNIKSLEIQTNIFGQVTRIEAMRAFPGTIEVKSLVDRLETKFSKLAPLSNRGDHLRVDHKNENFQYEGLELSFTVSHQQRNNNPMTEIRYSLSYRVEPKIITFYLMPDVKKLLSTIVEQHKGRVNTGEGVEI